MPSNDWQIVSLTRVTPSQSSKINYEKLGWVRYLAAKYYPAEYRLLLDIWISSFWKTGYPAGFLYPAILPDYSAELKIIFTQKIKVHHFHQLFFCPLIVYLFKNSTEIKENEKKYRSVSSILLQVTEKYIFFYYLVKNIDI